MKKATILSQKQWDEIVERVALGEPQKTLAEEFNISPSAVSFHCRVAKSEGFEIRAKNTMLSNFSKTKKRYQVLGLLEAANAITESDHAGGLIEKAHLLIAEVLEEEVN